MELRGHEDDSEGDDFLPNHRRLDHLGHLYTEAELTSSAPSAPIPIPSSLSYTNHSAFRRPLLFPSPLSSSPAPPSSAGEDLAPRPSGDNIAGPSSKSRPRPSPSAVARYRECQKNHAARIGGHVLDGCGEFMPGGEEGTAEALKCAACSCHRSFHRKELEGGDDGDALFLPVSTGAPAQRYFIPGNSLHGPQTPFSLQTPFASIRQKQHRALERGGDEENNYSGGTTTTESSSEEMRQQLQQQQMAAGSASGAAKKRHRTKFTAEQKEMMAEFAERVGWRMQKQDESAMDRFCREAGVSRQVFKVWMHNNKQHALKSKQQVPQGESQPAEQQAVEDDDQRLRQQQKPSSSSS